MNKIAHYLNTHMLGEVLTHPQILTAYSTDASVFHFSPEMVAYPRATSDVRKIARFSWQLAEKGHALSLTARGAGLDTTGGAIGAGMIVDTTRYMTRIFEYDSGQRLIRLQPGVSIQSLVNALGLHGTAIPELRWDQSSGSIGGSIATQRSALEYVDQLEVVLANGDVLQTKRISKRELEKQKGLQSFEGEIYRAVDGLIEDNLELLDEMVSDDDRLDHSGYQGLELVKEKNGSFDLTPLFVGSQGTLGVISEMILQADFVNQRPSMVVAAFAEQAGARDALDGIDAIDPTAVEYVDGSYFESARLAGKSFRFYEEAKEQFGGVEAVLLIHLNDFNERSRSKKMKRLLSLLQPLGAHIVADSDLNNSDLRSVHGAVTWLLNPEKSELSSPPVLDGLFVPLERFDVFAAALKEVMKHHHVTLALYGRPLDEIWYVRPLLKLGTVGDKQKLFKLAADLAALAQKHGGAAFGANSEGRMGAVVADQTDEHKQLFEKLRAIFDPHKTLNPGVKQSTAIRELARHTRSDYDRPAGAGYLSTF